MVGLDSTKIAFFLAFVELVQKKNVCEISVADIVDASNISKATFYRHFRDKYEVMNYRHSEFFKRNNPFTYNYNAGMNVFTDFFYRNREFYSSVSIYTGQNSFKDSLTDTLIECMSVYLDKQGCPNLSGPEMQFLINFYCTSMANSTIRWVVDDCRITSDKLSEYLYRALPSVFIPYFN